MNLQTVTDQEGKTLGFIELEDSGRQVAKDVSLFPIAYYVPEIDRTIDTSYRVITHGNTLISLVRYQTIKSQTARVVSSL